MPNGHNIVDTGAQPIYLLAMSEISDTIDAIGLLCPLPVLKLRKRLKPLPDGAMVQLLADDPAAIIDVPHFCSEADHTFLGQSDGTGHHVYLIRKGRQSDL